MNFNDHNQWSIFKNGITRITRSVALCLSVKFNFFKCLKASVIYIYVNTCIRKSNDIREPIALVRRNGKALSYNRSIHFRVALVVIWPKFSKGKMPLKRHILFWANEYVPFIYRSNEACFCSNVHSSVLQCQKVTLHTTVWGSICFLLNETRPHLLPPHFLFFSKWNTVFYFRSLLKIT